MLVNNKSFGKKLLVVLAAFLVASCVPAGGLVIYGMMLDMGQAEHPASSSNDLVP